jgi:hypothetical protein
LLTASIGLGIGQNLQFLKAQIEKLQKYNAENEAEIKRINAKTSNLVAEEQQKDQ